MSLHVELHKWDEAKKLAKLCGLKDLTYRERVALAERLTHDA